jgi:copper-binding protein NosD/uncharacterized protein DUF1565
MPSRFPARIAVALTALTVPLAVAGGYTVASAHDDGVTLHVSAAHGSDDNPCRRPAPCATIGRAVAAARPGDTIEVAAGTYHEDVAVTIRLSVEGTGHPVVDASGLANGFVISGPAAAGSTLDGFSVRNATDEGILAVLTHDVTITHNLVTHNDLGVFAPVPVGPCAVERGIPGDCGEGLHVNSVTHSRIVDNRVSENSGGILMNDRLGPAAHNLVARNAVIDNQLDCGITIVSHNQSAVAIPSGVPQPALAGVYDNTIVDNVVRYNGLRGFGGAIVMGGLLPGEGVYDNLVARNEADHNGLAGVTVHSPAPFQDLDGNVIVDNRLSQDGLAGQLGNRPGDFEAGIFDTVGIVVYSRFRDLSHTVVERNSVSDEHFGIWVLSAAPVSAGANRFEDVAVPVFQQ